MIHLRSENEIRALECAGKIVAQTFDELMPEIKKGVSTKELDERAEKLVKEKGGQPAFKGYRGFPAALCTSINEEIVHGIPSDRRLKEGDLISIDLGVEKDGFFADAALTVGIGQISEEAKKLIKITWVCLLNGINKTVAGNRIADISYSVQQTAEKAGFNVVREFVGHGIGTKIHEEPPIPNYGRPKRSPRIKKGMILAIEPMVCSGSWKTEILKDGWTAVTRDRKIAAHFEHTVAVTGSGPRILTLWQKKKLLW